jgi:hypothetical protein
MTAAAELVETALGGFVETAISGAHAGRMSIERISNHLREDLIPFICTLLVSLIFTKKPVHFCQHHLRV